MTAKNRATSLKRFWQGVESLPTLAAIESEWRDLLRDDFGAIQPFLSPRQELASSYPRFPTCGLPYRVVDHGGGDFVGVCDESHETIPLSATQLIVYELNQQRIAKQVATALGLSAAEPFGLPNMRT